MASASDNDQRFSVFGLGTVVVDHLVFVEAFPERDTKNEVSDHRLQVGGPVPTALVALSRWGVDTGFCGSWGDDPHGTAIEADLASHRVDCSTAARQAGAASGFAHVWVERGGGERTTLFYRGSHDVPVDRPLSDRLEQSDALHLDGWSTPAAIEAARAMKSSGGRVFLDLGSPKARLDELLPLVDTLNCPQRLLTALFEDADPVRGARRLRDMGVGEATVTMGKEGAWFVGDGLEGHQPAFPVEAVDTNGAGDTFSARLIFGTLQGWDPATRLRFACAAAALKCAGEGNREALPDLQDAFALAGL